MNDQTLLTHVRDRFPAETPTVNRVIREFKVSYQQAKRVLEGAFGPIPEPKPRQLKQAHLSL